ncbi:hypothetical protein MKK75_12430 [Methylobacterium sp. J-030]|uniref:hypothetical protein n=1 Tax=Methylobacterium sp. J-030 TaxID=2836627 RepID=UPI001FB88A89|nr:hypothetical protein [Methylobacterium sp. J-030]MCJ2069586.1 hypothetical protein [Methylobacterium sp. J-030]
MAVLAIGLSTGAVAQGRTDTRTVTCAALRAFVARSGNAVLASSDLAYETVHRDSGACEQDETGAPAYEPTLDVPACFAGWRCKQRNSDSGPV